MILALLACAADPVPDAPLADACAPADTTGLAVGDRARDVAMVDCPGAPTSLSGLCGRPALVVNWYGWCPSCADNAEPGRRLADEHADLSVVIALTEDPLGEPADADLCALYEETYPSAASIWLDADGALEVYGTTDLEDAL